MEAKKKSIEKLRRLIGEIKEELEVAKQSCWRNPEHTDVTVLNKLTEVDDKLQEMMRKIEEVKDIL